MSKQFLTLIFALVALSGYSLAWTTGNGVFLGDLNANGRICISTDCRTSWPTSGSGMTQEQFDANFNAALAGRMPVLDANLSALTWSKLTGYPSACPAGQYISAVDDTLTCSTPAGGASLDTNTVTAGWTNNTGRWLIDLNVNGDINAGAGLTLGGVRLTAWPSGLSQWTTSGTNIYFTGVGADGNVAIGKTIPTVALDVNGIINGDLNGAKFYYRTQDRKVYNSWEVKNSTIQQHKLAGQQLNDLNIMVIADSWGDDLVVNLFNYYGNRYGWAGGFISPNISLTNPAITLNRALSGWVLTTNDTGVTGLSATSMVSSTVGAWFDVNCYGTSLRVFYKKQVGGGDFNYNIDGVYAGTVSTAAASEYMATFDIPASAARHDFNILVASASPVELNGFFCNAGRPGTKIFDASTGGYFSSSFANIDDNAFTWQVKKLNPNVVIIMIGVNDACGAVSAETYQSNLDSIVSKVRDANDMIDIIIASQTAIDGCNLEQYLIPMENISRKYGVVFVDNYKMFSPFYDMNVLGAMQNGTHLNSYGYNALSNSIISAMEPQETTAMVPFKTIHSATDSYTSSFVGERAGNPLVTGQSNFGAGYRVLEYLTTGTGNTAVGISALNQMRTGSHNTAFGMSNQISVSTASFNTSFGSTALSAVTTGERNTIVGYTSGIALTTGGANTAIGATSLGTSVTGTNNTAVGNASLQNIKGGSYNTAIGESSGYGASGYLTGRGGGAYNSFLGAYSGIFSDNNYNYSTAIGAGAMFDNNRTIVIGGLKPTYDANVSIGGRLTESAKLDVNGDTKVRGDFNATGVGYVNLPAGGMWYDNEAGGTLAMGVANTWFYKGDMNAGYLYQATYSDGNITLQKAGTYLIGGQATIDAGNNDEIDISLLKNNVSQRNCYAARVLAIGVDDSSLSFTCFVTIAANDKIVLGFENSSTNNLTLHAANLTAIRVGK